MTLARTTPRNRHALARLVRGGAFAALAAAGCQSISGLDALHATSSTGGATSSAGGGSTSTAGGSTSGGTGGCAAPPQSPPCTQGANCPGTCQQPGDVCAVACGSNMGCAVGTNGMVIGCAMPSTAANCTINCEGTCQGKTVHCSAGRCEVDCTTPGSCKNLTVLCADGPCSLRCETPDACDQSTKIQCSAGQRCDLTTMPNSACVTVIAGGATTCVNAFSQCG